MNEARILKLRRAGFTIEQIREDLKIAPLTIHAVLKSHGMSGRTYLVAIKRAHKRAGRTFIYRGTK